MFLLKNELSGRDERNMINDFFNFVKQKRKRI